MKTINITLGQPSNENEININNLDMITDGSVTNLRVGSVLDFYPNRYELLQTLIKKLHYEGEIELLGSDLYDIARGLSFSELDLNAADALLYRGRQSIDTLQNMINILEEQFGLQIKIKRIYKYVYFIKAIRPAPNKR